MSLPVQSSYYLPWISNIMSNNLPIPPALISVPRIRTLAASLFVALASGTNYVRVLLIAFNTDMNVRNVTRSIQVRSAKFLCCIRTWSIAQLVDYLSLCSLFATTGNTAEDISHAVEHCCNSWKWCGVPSIPATYLTLFSRGLYFCSDMGTDCRFSWSSHPPCL